MSWKDIVKEDLTEKVIEALIPLYGSRASVLDSNIMGVMYEEELKDMPPYTKDDVKSLIEDMDFAATSFNDMQKESYQETRNQLKTLL
tara:strand:- start:677 stop:940 length:264 start_codon:yes stop_codon:yes gene_type:complete